MNTLENFTTPNVYKKIKTNIPKREKYGIIVNPSDCGIKYLFLHSPGFLYHLGSFALLEKWEDSLVTFESFEEAHEKAVLISQKLPENSKFWIFNTKTKEIV
jgi:hypothetical protein